MLPRIGSANTASGRGVNGHASTLRRRGSSRGSYTSDSGSETEGRTSRRSRRRGKREHNAGTSARFASYASTNDGDRLQMAGKHDTTVVMKLPSPRDGTTLPTYTPRVSPRPVVGDHGLAASSLAASLRATSAAGPSAKPASADRRKRDRGYRYALMCDPSEVPGGSPRSGGGTPPVTTTSTSHGGFGGSTTAAPSAHPGSVGGVGFGKRVAGPTLDAGTLTSPTKPPPSGRLETTTSGSGRSMGIPVAPTRPPSHARSNSGGRPVSTEGGERKAFPRRRFKRRESDDGVGGEGMLKPRAPPSRPGGAAGSSSRHLMRGVSPIETTRGSRASNASSDSGGEGKRGGNPFSRSAQPARGGTPDTLMEQQRRKFQEHVDKRPSSRPSRSSRRSSRSRASPNLHVQPPNDHAPIHSPLDSTRGGGAANGGGGGGGGKSDDGEGPQRLEGGASPIMTPRLRQGARRHWGDDEGKHAGGGGDGDGDNEGGDPDTGEYDPILLSSKGKVLLRASMATGQSIKWKKGKALGRGTFATVYKALNERTGGFIAVKILPVVNSAGVAVDKQLRVVAKEVNLMRQLSHPHIVRYLGCQRTDNNLAVLMELVPGGGTIRNLVKEFGALPEHVVRHYTRQMLSGLVYLHDQGVVHRDIKGANTLITTDGVAKLSDFGCSSQLDGDQTRSMNASLRKCRGTIPFMAPEVIKEGAAGRKSDVWSLGCTVIEMATGKAPWNEFTNPITAMVTIGNGGSPAIPTTLSPAGQDFVRRCVVVKPEARASARDLLDHPWLQEDDGGGTAELMKDGIAAAIDLVGTMEMHGTMATSDGEAPGVIPAAPRRPVLVPSAREHKESASPPPTYTSPHRPSSRSSPSRPGSRPGGRPSSRPGSRRATRPASRTSARRGVGAEQSPVPVPAPAPVPVPVPVPRMRRPMHNGDVDGGGGDDSSSDDLDEYAYFDKK